MPRLPLKTENYAQRTARGQLGKTWLRQRRPGRSRLSSQARPGKMALGRPRATQQWLRHWSPWASIRFANYEAVRNEGLSWSHPDASLEDLGTAWTLDHVLGWTNFLSLLAPLAECKGQGASSRPRAALLRIRAQKVLGRYPKMLPPPP